MGNPQRKKGMSKLHLERLNLTSMRIFIPVQIVFQCSWPSEFFFFNLSKIQMIESLSWIFLWMYFTAPRINKKGIKFVIITLVHSLEDVNPAK